MPILDAFGRPIPKQTPMQKAMSILRGEAHADLYAAYDAAVTTGENQKHWRWADDLSASAANTLLVRKRLRERSRYECLQSNSFGNGIVNTIANDTIATGPTLQVQMSPDMSRAIELRFMRWCKSVKLANKLRVARLSKCVDGESFLIRTTNPENGDAVKLDIRVIEADQVTTPGWMEGRPGAVDGIIFDVYNNPAIYHVMKQHPGDSWVLNTWDKVDIFAKDMIHLFNHVRPGQARGVPEVTPALPLFAMLRRYTLATILAAETAADFAAVIKTTANAWNSEGFSADPAIQPFDSVNIDRGMMTSLPYGWEMQQFRPEQPTSTYEGFRNAILQEIARCVHMPENKALGSSASYNYSSATLDDQIYWQSIDIERQNVWIDDCMERIFEWWWEEAVEIEGYLPAYPYLDLPPHRFNWPPRRSNDPGADATTAISLINAGLLLDRQYLDSQNIDPDWFFAEMEKQVERRKRWGTVSQEQATVMANQTLEPQSAEATDDPTATASKAFMGLSRLQWQRNRKAIMDVTREYSEGKLTRAQAEVMLSGLGLSTEDISSWLGDDSAELEAEELKAEKYESIDFTPPKGVREAAKRGLEVRASRPPSQRGGTAVGVARARDLSNGKSISPETARRMKAYFDRHEVDKKGETWDEQGKGWQAWHLWGGDAGQAWANKLVRQMNAEDEQDG